MRGNFAHYRSLYSILFVVVALYTVLSSPLLLLGLTIIAGAWAYAFVLNSPETPINIAGVELARRAGAHAHSGARHCMRAARTCTPRARAHTTAHTTAHTAPRAHTLSAA